MNETKLHTRLLIGGDFAARQKLTQELVSHNFSVLSELKDFIMSEECFSIINLECPVKNNSDKPICKWGPSIGGPAEMIDALEYLGVNMVTLANNHILDYGNHALNRTISLCRSHGILTVGAGRDARSASEPAILEVNEKKIGVVNCCEHEFSVPKDDNSPGANGLNVIKQYNVIKDLKTKVDYVLVIAHGGHEYFNLPSPRMQETYRFFIDAGADAVVNHHQHCYGGYEVYNERPIFYGLGNLVFETKSRDETSWNLGFMVILDLDETITFSIHPYRQCVNGINFKMLPAGAFDKEINRLNDIISDHGKLKDVIERYYKSEMPLENKILQPYTNRYLRALMSRGLFPSLIGSRFRLGLRNHIECESHLDKLRYYVAHK